MYKTKIRCSDGTEREQTNYNFREIADTSRFNIYDDNISVDLDPCPFCGVTGILTHDKSGWFGWCSTCDSKGPHSTWVKAAKMWNARSFKEMAEAKGTTEEELKSRLENEGFDMDRMH